VLIPSLFLAGFFTVSLVYVSNVSEASLSYIDFFGSLFFMQTILTELFANNRPLWSLANEFYYYILFPLITFVYYNKYKYISIFLISCIMLVLPINISLYFIIWLSGISILYMKRKILPTFVSLIMFIFILILSRIHFIDTLFLMDIIISISFILLINSLIHSNKNKFFLKINKFNEKLANFSYSLYLLHMPFVYLVVYYLHNYTNLNFSIMNTINILIFIVIIFIVVVYSYIISLITENKTSSIKNKLYNLVN